jgi:hypothetical protein
MEGNLQTRNKEFSSGHILIGCAIGVISMAFASTIFSLKEIEILILGVVGFILFLAL